ncbi:uncharacterized protein [Spinacia oleracea]|uniref:Retrovirus-related Pol polyprotein from transposon TNT 1-94-like beta-barrel domain-containing protein n=1 Tax=Spinacia oleracea TaxID=3562 RepID=A0ABM3R339_SPIOL|nr:uncharacterized protein LOC130464805 [Spinacia oleracea]
MSGANNSTFNLRPLIENKLNAHNFLQWEKAMRIVLRAEGKESVLENPLPLEPLPENATEAQCRAKQTLQDNSLQVTCLMLACMEPEYQKRFDGLDAYTIIQQLKTLFQKNARLGRLHSMMVQDEGNLPGEPEHKDVLMVKRGKQFKSINVIEVNLATTTSWVFDTACGSHIIGNVQGLKRSRSLGKGEVDLRVGNGARVAALAVGDYSLRLPSGLILELYNCYYVPVITKNIISIPILDSEGFSFQIMNNCCSAYLNGMFYVSAKLSNGLYVLDLQNHIYHIENKKHKPNDLNPTYLWHYEEALQLFSELMSCNIQPNDVTFLGVLTASTYKGNVNQTKEFFLLMFERYKLKPLIKHHNCMVNVLGQAGFLNEAQQIIKEMSIEPDAIILGSLLSSCRKHGNIEMAIRAGKHIQEIDSKDSSAYILMSNSEGHQIAS